MGSVNSKINQPWIPFDRIASLVQLEPALFIVALALLSWLLYKVFLKDLSPERHRNLRTLFVNLSAHLGVFIGLFVVYAISQKNLNHLIIADRVTSYFGLATLVSGAIVFVKSSRILLFEYLFFGHMKEGVPVLIVNLFTLMLSIGIVGWMATEILGVKLTPLLATSAIFSLVLGLALQDTLGNLFAGVALQLDKPYEIGHWIEIQTGGQKMIGQVQEITWRATVLVGLFDEHLIIPNRVISQAEVSNFSATHLPIWRTQLFKIPYTADISSTRELLTRAVSQAQGVRKSPEPLVLVSEANESWLVFRCSYTIDDYGMQWRTSNHVITAVVEELKSSGLGIAAQRLQIVKEGVS
jgi:small-conductance mechanosensitive channel